MEKQVNRAGKKVMVADVQLAYLNIMKEFEGINIDKPMEFIRWKRPRLSAEAQDAIQNAFYGRATKKSAKYIATVKGVLNEIKAA